MQANLSLIGKTDRILDFSRKTIVLLFGKKGFLVHSIATSILWLVLFVSFFQIPPSAPQQYNFPKALLFVGYVLQIAGVLIIIWSGVLLGYRRAWGIRYFDTTFSSAIEKRGPYRIFTNPIYDGICTLLIGTGLVTGMPFYFLAALTSFILLSVLLLPVFTSVIVPLVFLVVANISGLKSLIYSVSLTKSLIVD